MSKTEITRLTCDNCEKQTDHDQAMIGGRLLYGGWFEVTYHRTEFGEQSYHYDFCSKDCLLTRMAKVDP